MALSRTQVTVMLGIAQTLSWASSYYLLAVLARPISQSTSTSYSLVFGAFWSQAFDAADAGARALGALSGSAVTLTAALSVTAAVLVARAVKRRPR